MRLVNNEGVAALHYACRNKYLGLVSRLIELNVSLNQQMADGGATPLQIAMYTGNFNEARLLIKAGADVNIKDEMGTTPLLKLLFNESDANEVKKKGVAPRLEKHNISLLESLLEAGAKVNVEDSDGNTPLSIILKCHCKNIGGTCVAALKLLLSRGANLKKVKTILIKESSKSSYPLCIARFQYLGSVLYNNK